jgi:PKD repeat protein
MYWAVSSCSGHQQDPNEDDTGAVNAAYGVSVDFEIEAADGEALVGAVPFTAEMSIPDEFTENVTLYDWNFGDGTEHVVSDEPDPVEHTWTEEGQYTVTLEVEGNSEDCGGDWTARQRKVGVVLACSAPRPAFSSSNLGGFTVQMQNESELGAFGCITHFEWILDGNEDGALETYEPRWTFEDGAEHAVTLRASGLGGTEEVTQTIAATKKPDGGGCNSDMGGAASWGGLVMGIVAARSRRRGR